MKVIGLTGGIASGKSTVSRLLKDKGAVIIDADEISRKLMKKGSATYKKVIECFGDEILDKDENIKRKELGKLVFSDKKALKVLNDITHPAIIDEIKRNLAILSKNNDKIIVIDAALLLEVGLDSVVDEVWVVLVNEKTQLERLMKRDKMLDKSQAVARIKSQMSLQKRLKYADKIIDNNKNIEYTKRQVDKFWKELTKS